MLGVLLSVSLFVNPWPFPGQSYETCFHLCKENALTGSRWSFESTGFVTHVSDFTHLTHLPRS